MVPSVVRFPRLALGDTNADSRIVRSPMNRLSACLITFNEEHNLPRALTSLAGIADEIVVLDSGSTDRTAEIASTHGVSFFERTFTNHADQKKYAASCARNDWIFLLDADEQFTAALRNSLLEC